MSLKYCIRARLRGSHYYFEAKTSCKHKKPNNMTTCKTCLQRVGNCRKLQQLDSIKKNN